MSPRSTAPNQTLAFSPSTHVAHHLRAVGDPGAVVELRRHAVEFVERHRGVSEWSKTRIVGMHPRLGALAALRLADPAAKVAATQRCRCGTARQTHALATIAGPRDAGDDAGVPGRPERPVRVAATAVGKRSPFTPEGRAALVHAICHIEFNAINLALDAAWRFDGMPDAYYRDWLRVADEEAQHFTLLRDHLQRPGPRATATSPATTACGRMCEKTSDDVLARMALVPRTLEARGLDATPLIQAKLRRVGTPDALRARATSSTSSCATRSATWRSATTGTAGCASATGSTRWRTTACCTAGTRRRGCARRSTSKRARRAGFTDEELAGLSTNS